MTQDEANAFLDDLRESGDTNMFGAPAYLMAAYDITKEEAIKLTSEWMRTFTERHPRKET